LKLIWLTRIFFGSTDEAIPLLPVSTRTFRGFNFHAPCDTKKTPLLCGNLAKHLYSWDPEDRLNTKLCACFSSVEANLVAVRAARMEEWLEFLFAPPPAQTGRFKSRKRATSSSRRPACLKGPRGWKKIKNLLLLA
jgi:hypothetical protein